MAMSGLSEELQQEALCADAAPRRFDPFRILSPAERRAQLDGYHRFLRERDGELDFPRRILTRRETYFRALERERVAWEGAMDVDAFYQHLHRVGAPPLDARTTWLLAAAKANQMESYGVEGEIEKWVRRGYGDEDEIVLYDLIEEQYHSRILVEVCHAGGLGGVRLSKPDWLIRAIIHVMQHFPDRLRYVPIVCGETLACIVFQVLLEHCHLFSDEPEVEKRLRSLLTEILVDETGHVLYCRAHMGPIALRIARQLMPLVNAYLLKDVRELRALGLSQAEIARRCRSGIEIPPQYDWLDGDPPGASSD